MDKEISHTVIESCRKLGIVYKSINENYVEYRNDAQELCQIYRDLKELAARLQEISDKYKLSKLKRLLDDDIRRLEDIDHDIIKLAHSINKEEDKCSDE